MINNIITGIFTLLGIGIGGIISYINSTKISDRKEFQKAAVDFHETFIDVLMFLDRRYHCEEDRDKTPFDIIDRYFPQHIKAMLRFRLYLPIGKRKRFTEAWKEYAGDGERGEPYTSQYDTPKIKGRPTREVALDRINNLLKFMNPDYEGEE